MTSSNAPYEIEYKLYPNYLHARVIAEGCGFIVGVLAGVYSAAFTTGRLRSETSRTSSWALSRSSK